MKYLMILFLLSVSLTSDAQIIVDSLNINNLKDCNYIEISCKPRWLLERIDVHVDYGQDVMSKPSRSSIQNVNGTKIVFSSYMQILNFFDNNGWDLVESKTTFESRRIRRVFLLKKEK